MGDGPPAPEWANAPRYPSGSSREHAFADPPKGPPTWCAVDRTTTEWTRGVHCVLPKPGVSISNPDDLKEENFYMFSGPTCESYLKSSKLDAYAMDRDENGKNKATKVEYEVDATSGMNRPFTKYAPPGDAQQCGVKMGMSEWNPSSTGYQEPSSTSPTTQVIVSGQPLAPSVNT